MSLRVNEAIRCEIQDGTKSDVSNAAVDLAKSGLDEFARTLTPVLVDAAQRLGEKQQYDGGREERGLSFDCPRNTDTAFLNRCEGKRLIFRHSPRGEITGAPKYIFNFRVENFTRGNRDESVKWYTIDGLMTSFSIGVWA